MATNEALVLDTLALNDGTTFTLEALDMTPPPELEEWIRGADSDGSLLAREPRCDNRVITAQIRVEPQATMNLALAKIALIVDKLKECQRQANGLALTWVPANSTLGTITFRCLSGQVTQLPIDVTNGWFVNAPLLTVKLTCLPFGEGTEAQVATITSGAPIIVLPDITTLAGDVPALGRLVVTDAASKDRRYVMWGLESRYYPTSSPPSLIIDSTSMVTTGFSGVTATRTAAYSGATNNVIGVTVRTVAQAVCGLGNLSHVGQFRPQLRFYASATTIAVRLTYKSLDNPLRSLSYQVPVAVGFNHVDLGLVLLDEVKSGGGTQRWTGQIEVISTATGGETFQVDAMWLMPAEQFGRARGTYAYQSGTLAAYDDFNGRVAGVALGTTAMELGGNWATSGAAGDFAAADAPLATDETMARSASDAGFLAPRWAIAGATNYTNTEVGVDVHLGPQPGFDYYGVVARWTDANNRVRLMLNAGFALVLEVMVGGVPTNYVAYFQAGDFSVAVTPSTWYRLRLVIYASGAAVGMLMSAGGGSPLLTVRTTQSVLATGGTLATGKPGIADSCFTGTRYYDNFYAAVPAAEPIVCYSTQSIEFRHSDVIREDASGTYYGQPPEYVGARFKIPNAGGPARETRVAVIARRNDIETAADDDLASNATTDSTTVTAFATPRYLVVPR